MVALQLSKEEFMLGSIFFTLTLSLGLSAFATPDLMAVTRPVAVYAAQNFTKGDQANYNLDIGGYVQGQFLTSVLDVTPEGVWIQQVMDLGPAGKRDVRELIDPLTGDVKKIIVDGKEEAPSLPGQSETIETREESLTVPAGTFPCVYTKTRTTEGSVALQSEQWMAVSEIPVLGLVKLVAQSGMGPVTAELTSFKRM